MFINIYTYFIIYLYRVDINCQKLGPKSFLQFGVTIISYTSRIDVVNLEAYTDSCKIIDSDIGES
jgi:hypothetical protein